MKSVGGIKKSEDSVNFATFNLIFDFDCMDCSHSPESRVRLMAFLNPFITIPLY